MMLQLASWMLGLASSIVLLAVGFELGRRSGYYWAMCRYRKRLYERNAMAICLLSGCGEETVVHDHCAKHGPCSISPELAGFCALAEPKRRASRD